MGGSTRGKYDRQVNTHRVFGWVLVESKNIMRLISTGFVWFLGQVEAR